MVSEAANNIVAAFGSHDSERYFSYFSPEATFIFYTSERQLNSRKEYEDEWLKWEAGGFRVLSAISSDPHIQFSLDNTVAIFTHSVRTSLNTGTEVLLTGERETIIFENQEGRWMAIHEHLSGDPTFT